MKHFFLIALCLSFTLSGFSQDTYTVNGESYELKTEVSGTLDLLWNVIDKQYRYFIKKGDVIIELKNTKSENKDYQEEYKATLKELTTDATFSTEKLKFTLPSLKDFVNEYNASQDPNYVIEQHRFKLQTRIGVLGGTSNVPFVDNPNNETLSMFFGEVEFFDGANAKRHSIYIRAKHIAEKETFKYGTTQIGLGYRFKIIKSNAFNFYTNVTFTTLNFTTATFSEVDQLQQVTTRDESATNFDLPFIFGVGLDLKLTKGLYFTVDYDELFAVFLDNQGNTSKHLALGVKFDL